MQAPPRDRRNRGRWRYRVAAPALALALVAGSASIASAGEPFIDLPLLDSELDRDRGPVGSTVNVEVDTDHIVEHCTPESSDFVAQFVDPEVGAEDEIDDTNSPLLALARVVVEEDYDDDIVEEDAATDPTLFAVLALVGLVEDVRFLYHSEDPTELDEMVSSTFGFGFGEVADVVEEDDGEIRYLDYIEPIETFDPATGEGSIEVLDLDPGIQTLMVGCIGIPTDLDPDGLREALAAAAEHVETSDDFPIELDQEGGFDEESLAALAESTTLVLYASLMELRAGSWNDFCIEDADGACPGDEPPAPPAPPVEPPAPAPAPPAAPVRTQPAYTG